MCNSKRVSPAGDIVKAPTQQPGNTFISFVPESHFFKDVPPCQYPIMHLDNLFTPPPPTPTPTATFCKPDFQTWTRISGSNTYWGTHYPSRHHTPLPRHMFSSLDQTLSALEHTRNLDRSAERFNAVITTCLWSGVLAGTVTAADDERKHQTDNNSGLLTRGAWWNQVITCANIILSWIR